MASDVEGGSRRRDAVAVFGSSEPLPRDDAYARARRLGALLAAAGHPVITGGYGGVMEGASRGAREAGGEALGVACRIFDGRSPNAWLSEIVPTSDLYERTRELIERAVAYVVLPGKAGTLAEVAWLWALDRAGCLPGRPVILLGDAWRSVVELLERNAMLEPQQLSNTHLVETPEQAVELLERLHRGGNA